MTEAEFERRQAATTTAPADDEPADAADAEPIAVRPAQPPTRTRSTSRSKPAAKPRRVQRMFAIEEDLDRKLWLYAIHIGKDRSDVVNDLLRPVVASMVLYDSRDRRSSSPAGQGGRYDNAPRASETDDQAEVA
jgi:hypothetical protein